eukprot:COSAG05_NODE_3292_length_2173_cov_1.792189_3_plen_281_part_01
MAASFRCSQPPLAPVDSPSSVLAAWQQRQRWLLKSWSCWRRWVAVRKDVRRAAKQAQAHAAARHSAEAARELDAVRARQQERQAAQMAALDQNLQRLQLMAKDHVIATPVRASSQQPLDCCVSTSTMQLHDQHSPPCTPKKRGSSAALAAGSPTTPGSPSSWGGDSTLGVTFVADSSPTTLRMKHLDREILRLRCMVDRYSVTLGKEVLCQNYRRLLVTHLAERLGASHENTLDAALAVAAADAAAEEQAAMSELEIATAQRAEEVAARENALSAVGAQRL